MDRLSSPELLRVFADALPFGVYVVDSAGMLVVWNKAAEDITGYLGQAMIGRRFESDLFIPAAALLEETLDYTSHEQRSHLYFRHAQGHRVPVRARTEVLRNERGAAIGTVRLFHDLSAGDESLCWLGNTGVRLDHELGIPTQLASEEQLQLYLEQGRRALAIFMLSVEDLRKFEKRYGSEMVRVTLRAVAKTISRLLPISHFFGCWSEGRFLLLVPECDGDLYEGLHTKLDSVGSACGISWWGDRIIPRVRVAGTYAQEGESVDALTDRVERRLRQ